MIDQYDMIWLNALAESFSYYRREECDILNKHILSATNMQPPGTVPLDGMTK